MSPDGSRTSLNTPRANKGVKPVSHIQGCIDALFYDKAQLELTHVKQQIRESFGKVIKAGSQVARDFYLE